MGGDHAVDYPSLAAWISRWLAILVSLRDDIASVDIRSTKLAVEPFPSMRRTSTSLVAQKDAKTI